MSDIFTNNAASPLAAAVVTTPAAGTIETWTLTSAATPLPQAASGVSQYRAVVGFYTDPTPEIVIVVATLSTTTVSVSRGAEGSPIKTHAIGDPLTHIFTAAVLGAFVTVTVAPSGIPTLNL